MMGVGEGEVMALELLAILEISRRFNAVQKGERLAYVGQQMYAGSILAPSLKKLGCTEQELQEQPAQSPLQAQVLQEQGVMLKMVGGVDWVGLNR